MNKNSVSLWTFEYLSDQVHFKEDRHPDRDEEDYKDDREEGITDLEYLCLKYIEEVKQEHLPSSKKQIVKAALNKPVITEKPRYILDGIDVDDLLQIEGKPEFDLISYQEEKKAQEKKRNEQLSMSFLMKHGRGELDRDFIRPEKKEEPRVPFFRSQEVSSRT